MININRRLKRILPRSLYGRFLLIIILPTVLAQAIAVHIFYDRHWGSMSRNMASSLVGEISMLVDGFTHSKPEEHNSIVLEAISYMGLSLHLTQDATDALPSNDADPFPYFTQQLSDRIDYPFSIQDVGETENLHIYIQIPAGRLEIIVPSKRLANPTTYIFILWMTGTAALLTIVAVLFLRGQMRSIINLTKAAEKFGKGHDIPSFKPSGATEVRLASIAFIEMKERIKRLMSRRTQMLAGISHDLRTPLTRMKLQLAMMEQNEATIDMQEDVVEMERMLEGYLDFVRGESNEPTKDINLKQFVQDILTKYKNDEGRVEFNIDEDITVHIKEHSFKRALTNLVSNGLRYGSFVCVTAYCFNDNKSVSIFIDDNGMGIPEEDRKKVFQPFYRLEHSRNVETGGVGLGLAITRDIVHRHGGEITLDTATLGGLRAIITLPL
jgi:two-component system osmolarity sensor histidine kinase EnvZ